MQAGCPRISILYQILSVATGPAQRNVKSCTPVELRVNTEMTPVLAGRCRKQDNNPLIFFTGNWNAPAKNLSMPVTSSRTQRLQTMPDKRQMWPNPLFHANRNCRPSLLSSHGKFLALSFLAFLLLSLSWAKACHGHVCLNTLLQFISIIIYYMNLYDYNWIYLNII